MAIMISSLDQGNPLHLLPNDSNCASIVNIKLTGVENYRVWASAIKLALHIKNKMGFLTGSCLRSDYAASRPLFEQWDRCNVVVLNWILSSLSQDVYLGHVFSDNAASVWNELKETYDRIDGAEIIDHGKLMRLMQFLMGLDDVYQPIRSSILTREILREVKDAFLIISREESHRGIPTSSVKSENASSVKSEKPQVSAFVSRFNDNNNKKRNTGSWSNGNNATSGNRGNYDSLLCKNCGLKGHTVDRCFELIGYPPGFKRSPNLKPANNNNRNSNAVTRGGFVSNVDGKTLVSPVSLSNEQMLKLMSLLNDKSSTTANANMAGANQRMTNSVKNMFNLVDVFGLKLTVGHPNGTLAKITHVGNLKLNNDVILFDVLVVPEYTDLKKGKFLGTGSEFAGLYLFDEKYNVSSTPYKNLIFFDNFESQIASKVSSPNDDEEGSSSGRDGRLHQPDPVSDNQSGSDAMLHQPGDDIVASQPGHDELQSATPVDETNSSEGNVGINLEVLVFQNILENQNEEVNMRRSSRTSKLPARLNDYVLNNTARYGLNKYVNHSMLSVENYAFVSSLNKSCEPSSFEEASKDVNWINAMNNEMHALYENNTWELVDLLYGRKPIGSRWSHFNLALRLLRYLKLAPGSGIDFSKDNSGIQVVAYSDSDWTKCPMTRRSIRMTGNFLGGGSGDDDGTTPPTTKEQIGGCLSALSARGWFEHLPGGSIDGCAELRKQFTTRFSTRRACFRDPTEIAKIMRKTNETLVAFKERWIVETRFIEGVSEVMKISSFMGTHKCPELAKWYSDKVPKTVDEMMVRLDDFVRSEEAFASIELPKGELSEAPKKLGGATSRREDRFHMGGYGADRHRNDGRNTINSR
ncbi:ribonuclease H-like domain-containing protein [Tanacetum coccineum]